MHRNTLHLFGFAQPNIVYPTNLHTQQMDFFERWLNRLKFEIQAWFFTRADELVVELEHVKVGLYKRRLFRNKVINVVYSSVHSVFTQAACWAPLVLGDNPSGLKLGVISRNYPHKNLAILVEVKRLLLERYGREVNIFVTFTAKEWAACEEHFRENIINVGGLSLSQCPTFYSAMDGIVFPSLLECFSAVPIETLIMKRPLFASNLSFIKDVCGEHCNYFLPLDPADIARVIDAYFHLPLLQQQNFCEVAYAYVKRFPEADKRAAQYLKLIGEALSKVQINSI